MSTTTPNYGFIKTELTDSADITASNPNWDKVDSELKNRAILEDGKIPYDQIPSAKSWDIVVPTVGWIDSGTMKYFVVNVTGMSESYNPTYGLKPSGDYATEDEEDAFALIKGLVTSNGSVTLYSSEVPTTSITLILKEV